ncbi:MAG: polysaccharide export protein [Metallibacterium scheffleri]|jgi:polysaccharide export outer membrane protein|uniref:polysaccharide biosynthesis/export family protein n=1 Tax=Metallibacterium scheffleri TaxID=993689 RepID=UPI0026EED576|nr:polysaccharide biosynthesis/export family protein [Metallibacterium scheffleri]MCK9367453.1 polysaccharide export protein [Metallibacterium scheffleri]
MGKPILKFVLLVCGLLLLAACASNPPADTVVPMVSPGARAFNPAALLGPEALQYRLGPGDLLEVSVFQVKDFNKVKVRVDSVGDVALPLAGVVKVGGLTVNEARQAITRQLAATYLQDPQVSLFVDKSANERFTVDGAVHKPGVYPMVGQMNLLQAIAMAEGPTTLANDSRVVIFRAIDGKPMAARFDIDRIRAGTMIDPPLYPNDIIVVDESGLKSTLKGIVDNLRGFLYFQAYKL